MSITTIIQAYPIASTIIIAAVVSLLSMLATKYLTNQERLKELTVKQKEHQRLMKEHKGDQQKMMEIQKEMMSGSMERMKSSFKPMIVTLIPFLLLFNFMRKVLETTPAAKSWFWYYLITAIVLGTVWKKILKVH
ncbi:MAG: EMC3/TMCO1 family protein [Nanoarchaeota archaeon]